MRLPLVKQWLQRTLHVLNYVHVLRFTYKQAITGTFGITLSANVLPLQLIYDKKPAQSFPKSKTPETFILECKLKTFLHTIPCVKDYQEKLKLEPSKPTLMMLDVLSGHMTTLVVSSCTC